MLAVIFLVIQFIFSVIIGLYFLNLLRTQQGNKGALEKESKKEMEKLRKLRELRLTEPLSEKTRPATISEIIGQNEGIKALRAAICSPNPQHVIIYGPPGIGKTAAARAILEEAKKAELSPFRSSAKFIEIDATTLRFDERGIADPLIGSVHDPIYQGAGSYGVAGVPQPKAGAVTKAHGGVLFIDEIGELHPIQTNKLLKVLEDRKVLLESVYYASEDNTIPQHIHDIFQKGLPADFRLISATTRSADEICPALRSRCIEIYFTPLKYDDIIKIVDSTAIRAEIKIKESAKELIAKYAQNGRDAVNIMQMSYGISLSEERFVIRKEDVEWVLHFGNYNPRIEKKAIDKGRQVGYVNGLAVTNGYVGEIIEIEASAVLSKFQKGSIKVTGIIDQEEIEGKSYKLKRMSSSKASVDNAITVINKFFKVDCDKYDIHLNFPGGVPMDGPSAGIAITMAIYSAIKGIHIESIIALTGEISITGKVKPVGGVVKKVEAARNAGIKKVIIPKENWQDIFAQMDVEVISVENILEVANIVFNGEESINNIIKESKALTISDLLVAYPLNTISKIAEASGD